FWSDPSPEKQPKRRSLAALQSKPGLILSELRRSSPHATSPVPVPVRPGRSDAGFADRGGGGASRVPVPPPHRSRGRFSRRAGPRPVPLAGGGRAQVGGGGRLGRGPEQAHLRLPGGHSPAREDSPPAQGVVELRALLRAGQGGRALLLQQERRPAEPVGAVHD